MTLADDGIEITLTNYSLFRYAPNGTLLEHVRFEAIDDESAIGRAGAEPSGTEIEVRRGPKLVVRLSADRVRPRGPGTTQSGAGDRSVASSRR